VAAGGPKDVELQSFEFGHGNLLVDGFAEVATLETVFDVDPQVSTGLGVDDLTVELVPEGGERENSVGQRPAPAQIVGDAALGDVQIVGDAVLGDARTVSRWGGCTHGSLLRRGLVEVVDVQPQGVEPLRDAVPSQSETCGRGQSGRVTVVFDRDDGAGVGDHRARAQPDDLIEVDVAGPFDLGELEPGEVDGGQSGSQVMGHDGFLS